MIPWLKKLFTDETVFIRVIRAVIMFLGVAILTNQIELPFPWMKQVGTLVVALASFIGAGEKNPKKETPDDQSK